MLSDLLRLARARWMLIVPYMFNVWRRLLRFISTTSYETSETSAFNTNSPDIKQGDAVPLEPAIQEFPAATDDQKRLQRKQFIESLDLDAVCALASRHNNGKTCKVVNKVNGSFNICFFVEFHQDGPKWVVRVPIKPALDNAWDKLLSEVITMQ